MIDVTALERADWHNYDLLVRRSPHGSLWSLSSLPGSLGADAIVIGAYRGKELIGGVCLPVADGSILRYLPSQPWNGPVGRGGAEGENCAIAGALAEYLRSRYDEVTLTCAPEWTDIREFLWRGFRPHVRYTYRGVTTGYEKRVVLHDCFVQRDRLRDDAWAEHRLTTGDSDVTTLTDWRCAYYWKANKGGAYHADCISTAIQVAQRDGLLFDMVGANSPQRGLFKRGFGLPLVPYYAVTTSDASDLRAT